MLYLISSKSIVIIYSFPVLCSVLGLVSRHGSAVKNTVSPKKEDSKVGLKSSTTDKVTGEVPKRTITKPVSTAAPLAKTSAKPEKTSAASTKLSSVATTKTGHKPKRPTELSAEKASQKSGDTCQISSAAASKKSGIKRKDMVNGKLEPAPGESTGEDAVHEHSDGVVEPEPAADTQTTAPGEADVLSLLVKEGPEQSLHKTDTHSENTSGNETSVTPATNIPPHVKPANAGKQPSSCDIPAKVNGLQPSDVSSANLPKYSEHPVDTPCSLGSTETPSEDMWSGIHHQVSPESETGSTHTTSSDDIKPRSEDYDAGGSQDDDCSNDRAVSKCGTMRCHDFLGRSSSDTSTPEELKLYEGGVGLRVEVRLRGRDTETTSEDEGVRLRPHSWLQRDEAPVEEEHSEVEATVTVKCTPDHQLFLSSEEDDDEEATEDERSEVEVIPGQAPTPPIEPSSHFQGIVNLAFDDDGVDQESEQPNCQSTSNFRRSVLLSVDECEELGSEEGGVPTPPHHPDDAVTPCDVFESDSTVTSDQNHLPSCVENEGIKHKKEDKEQEEKSSLFLTEIQEPEQKSNHTQANALKPSGPILDDDTSEVTPQERPRHLDLQHAEQYNRKLCRNTSDSKKADLHLDLNELHLTGDSPVHAAQTPTGNV